MWKRREFYVDVKFQKGLLQGWRLWQASVVAADGSACALLLLDLPCLPR